MRQFLICFLLIYKIISLYLPQVAPNSRLWFSFCHLPHRRATSDNMKNHATRLVRGQWFYVIEPMLAQSWRECCNDVAEKTLYPLTEALERDPNCVTITANKAEVQANKERVDGVPYYTIFANE